MNTNLIRIEILRDLIGPDLFRTVVETLGGQQLRIPSRAEHFNILDRNRRIKEMYYGGIPYEQIAEMFDLSLDRVRKIINQ